MRSAAAPMLNPNTTTSLRQSCLLCTPSICPPAQVSPVKYVVKKGMVSNMRVPGVL